MQRAGLPQPRGYPNGYGRHSDGYSLHQKLLRDYIDCSKNPNSQNSVRPLGQILGLRYINPEAHARSGRRPKVTINNIRIMKVYVDRELYSIYDRFEQRYIFKITMPEFRNCLLTYNDEGFCTLVRTPEGRVVYRQPREA